MEVTRADQIQQLAERLQELLNDAEAVGIDVWYTDVGELFEYGLHPQELDADDNSRDLAVTWSEKMQRWEL